MQVHALDRTTRRLGTSNSGRRESCESRRGAAPGPSASTIKLSHAGPRGWTFERGDIPCTCLEPDSGLDGDVPTRQPAPRPGTANTGTEHVAETAVRAAAPCPNDPQPRPEGYWRGWWV